MNLMANWTQRSWLLHCTCTVSDSWLAPAYKNLTFFFFTFLSPHFRLTFPVA
jgi:hypothetical protein